MNRKFNPGDDVDVRIGEKWYHAMVLPTLKLFADDGFFYIHNVVLQGNHKGNGETVAIGEDRMKYNFKLGDRVQIKKGYYMEEFVGETER